MAKKRRSKHSKKMSKKKKVILGILATFLVLILASCGGVYWYTNTLINKMEKVEINKENIGVDESLSEYNDKITNIALFGIDAEDGNIGRSDSIMIATFDNNKKKLKLTSIMRDSYVDIDGHGKDKINHAYAFGGPELAISTLNKNFKLNIEDFVAVNFTNLPKIIDALGGIDLDIDSEELNYINNYIQDINNKNGTSSKNISRVGNQHVDGTQALAYCRIRYTSGGDQKRTERQREVLSKLFEKVSTQSITSFPSLLDVVLPMVQTSMKSSEILGLGSEVLKMGIPNIEQERFPLDNYSSGKMINGVYYMTYDNEATINQMRDYIFEDKISW